MIKHLAILLLLVFQILCAAGSDNGLTKAVEWDQNSIIINGERAYLYCAEFHYWRIPVPELYLDVLQKIKAAGFNSVSIYFHWGYHSAAANTTDFETGAHDIQKVFDACREAGLWVVARPGPYINAETTGGGYPGYLLNIKDSQRTSEYESYWSDYVSKVGKIIAQNEITKKNGVVILNQVENELQEPTPHSASSSVVEYMEQLKSAFRDSGITVPFIHNDVGKTYSWSSAYEDVGGSIDMYSMDSYPDGFNCDDPDSGFQVQSYRSYLEEVSEGMPFYTAEFQSGAFDPWGGPGYENCAELISPEFANVFYKNNIAQGFVLQSLYMTFGGTNWGQLAAPVVYTSYDYGAPIDENRQLREKTNEIKLQANFLRVTPDILGATLEEESNQIATDDAIYTTALVNKTSDARFYIVRHNDSRSHDTTQFKIKVNAGTSEMTIPQVGSTILHGRQSKIFVTNYPIIGTDYKVVYSTAEIYTVVKIDEMTVLIAYTDEGDQAEISVTGGSSSLRTKTLAGTVNSQQPYSNYSALNSTSGGTLLSYTQGAEKTIVDVDEGKLQVWLVSREEAFRIWTPIVSGDKFNPSPGHDQVGIVNGPYLVRNVSISDDEAHISGDTNETTKAEFQFSNQVKKIYWNGKEVSTSSTSHGAVSGELPGPDSPAITMDLTKDWKFADSLPEISPDYDDSNWIDADHETTNNPNKPPCTPVLYADDYGFHQGSLIYRARFDGEGVTGFNTTVSGGSGFGFSIWLNGKFLFSSNGIGQVETQTANITIDNSQLIKGKKDNVLVLLQDHNGREEFGGVNNPRGIVNYSFVGGKGIPDWKIQGNAGGEGNIDKVRGPLNEGGLYGERLGWALPGFDDSDWESKSLTDGIDSAGVGFYRKTVKLNREDGIDQPLVFEFPQPGNDTHYRAQLFVNGYQYGKYAHHIGPQFVYPVPPGILNYNGDNIVALSVWTQDEDGGAIEEFNLKSVGTYSSGFSFDIDGKDLQPEYDSDRKRYS